VEEWPISLATTAESSPTADAQDLVQPVRDELVADAGGVVAPAGEPTFGPLDAVLGERCCELQVDLPLLLVRQDISRGPELENEPGVKSRLHCWLMPRLLERLPWSSARLRPGTARAVSLRPDVFRSHLHPSLVNSGEVTLSGKRQFARESDFNQG